MKLGIKNTFIRLISSSLVRTSGIYTISGFINAAIPLLLLPILTRRLTPTDYGIVAMFQLAVSVVYPFIGINLEGAIQRRYYDKDKSDFASYIGTCLTLFFGSFIIVAFVFYLFNDQIVKSTQIQDVWIKYILIVAACQFITSVVLVIFQVKVQPFKYGILQISQSLINISLTIVFVVILNKSWEGRLEAQIFSGILVAFISLLILYRLKLIKVSPNWNDAKNAMRFGLPLIPHAIGGMLFSAIDRFFLTNLLGLNHTGNYTVAFQLGSIISLFTVSFNNAFVPWLFENLNKEEIEVKKKIVRFTYSYFVILAVGALLLIWIFPSIISIFVGDRFNSVNTYSVFIVFGFVFQGMYFMVTNYINFVHKTYLQAALTISVGLIKIPITYFSILWFGAIGASISFCLSFFIFFLSTWILSAKIYPMPWLLKQ